MPPVSPSPVAQTLSRYWGFDQLRPLQAQAVDATLQGRDALVVLPTGGGKSLCYQLPPLLRPASQPALCLVVSPLIALMKDQVDGLRLAGYPAAALHGNVSAAEATAAKRDVEAGRCKLLLLSPERLLSEGMAPWLQRIAPRVASVAIDEAHCISQWGHDFRPEYRRLAELRDMLPGVPFQAYTATATPRVRADIMAQLHMRDPAEIVGDFDRANLTYRVMPRVGNGEAQVEEILRRRAGDAAIVYCISRKQTESLAEALLRRGVSAAAYHAGLDTNRRSAVQDDFIAERLDVVVATVAFGMGIDRGDVRLVVHASCPKSVEAYQQETGRAGRDGLPAECVLLYSAADRVKWTQIMERPPEDGSPAPSPEVLQAGRNLLFAMVDFASGSRCRHRALVEYFGQAWEKGPCEACDVCLGELEVVPDSTILARKILSGVARLAGTRGEAFGAAYIAEVLRGAKTAKVLERGHDQLTTWGLLKELDKDTLVTFINQLVDGGLLSREEGAYPVLRLTEEGVRVLKGHQEVTLRLMRSSARIAESDRKRKRVEVTGAETVALSTDDKVVFEALRALRRTIAAELKVPPYIVFSDATLEEMSRARPQTAAAFLRLRGVGEQKLERFGARFLALLGQHAAPARSPNAAPRAAATRPPAASETGARAPAPRAPVAPPKAASRRMAAPPQPPALDENRLAAFVLFANGRPLDEVAAGIGRPRATVTGYLCDYIAHRRPRSIAAWVSDEDLADLRAAVATIGAESVADLHAELCGTMPMESIQIALAFLADD